VTGPGESTRRADAPAPDSPVKPQSPTELRKPSWLYTARLTLHQFTADQCMDLAASLTYYLVLSLFPGLLALVSLLGIVGQGKEATDALLGIVRQLAPGNAVSIISDVIEQFTRSPATGVALVVGIVGALWSASGYVGAFGRAMNRIYQIDEGRPAWKLRPVQLGVTLVTIVLIVVIAVTLVVSGPVAEAIGNVFNLGSTAVFVWSVAKWPVLVLAVVVIIAVLYYATPNIKQPKFRWMSIGAFLAVVILAVASTGFGFYVANFSNYDRTYGSLGGVIVFLLWLWIANLALLFGAEFDSEMERSRELQAGIRAEETLQLPPRDTKVSRKAADKVAGDILKGRTLRVQSSRFRMGRSRRDEENMNKLQK
jgi:membrane protein